MIIRRTICVAVAMLGFAATPLAAAQKFCAPEGTLEIDPASVHYAPKNPTDKTKVVLSTVKAKTGFDAIIAARLGQAAMFSPDAQAHYTVNYGFPQPKWKGWSSCN